MNRKQPRPPFPAQHQKKPGAEHKLSPRPRYKAPGYKGTDKLKGKVAIITGGDSGIGRAVATLFAREGASIVITHLEPERKDARTTKAAVTKEGQKILVLEGDVTDQSFCEYAIEHTIDEYGRLDIVVNNAAYQQHQTTITNLTTEQWDHTFQTNMYGYFYMVKAALPHLKPGSSIINTGSIVGMRGSKDLLDYSATKGAVHAFTKSLAQNLIDEGIRVNCVAPGPVWTPLNPSDKSAEEVVQFGADTPMGRPAQPEEIAPAFVFLASNIDSSYITGEILTLLGGEVVGS